MFSINKVKVKSGFTAVQVIVFVEKKSIIINDFGIGKENSELSILKIMQWKLSSNIPITYCHSE